MVGDVYGDIHPYWFQTVSPKSIGELNLTEQTLLRPAALAHMSCFLTIPSLVKTHHGCYIINDIPLFPMKLTSRVIYVVRDPRDIVASFANHMGLDIDGAIEAMQDHGKVIVQAEQKLAHILRSWSDHVDSWIFSDAFERDPEHPKPLVVRYENLSKDAETELTRILQYMGVKEPDGNRVKLAVEQCQFEIMKEKEEEIPFPEASSNKKSGKFFRKGRVGTYKDELTAEQIKRVEKVHGEVMRKLGYKLTKPKATKNAIGLVAVV